MGLAFVADTLCTAVEQAVVEA